MTFDAEFIKDFYETYIRRRRLYDLALQRCVDELEAILGDREAFSVAERRRSRVDPGRIKEAARLLAKVGGVNYAGLVASPDDVFDVVFDIAGTRVTSNTTADVQRVVKAIEASDLLPYRIDSNAGPMWKDYISSPKASGYRAYHQIVLVSVPYEGALVALRTSGWWRGGRDRGE